VIRIDGTQTQSFKRKPQYVSPATQSMSVNVTLQGSTTSISGFPKTVNLTSTSNGCVSTLASTQCTLTFDVPPGSYDATLTSYDGANATGNVLSAAQGVPFVITAGAANTLAVVLGGVPTAVRIISDSATIIGDPLGFILPTGASAPVTVLGVDADGNYILGAGAPVVGLTSTDTTQFTVSGPTASAPNRFTITNVGNATAAATLNATVIPSTQSGGSSLTASIKIFSHSGTAPSVSGISAAFVDVGETVTETITGTNFEAGATTVNVSGTLVAVSNVTVNSTTSLTATFAVDPGAALTSHGITVTTPYGTATSTFTVLSDLNVVVTTDAGAGTLGTGPGAPGDLRFAMLNAVAGSTIVFNYCGLTCPITLNGPLPPIIRSLTIDGGMTQGDNPPVVIDGNGNRVFFVDSGTVVLHNLQIQNARAQGGTGGGAVGGGGGGGAGLGAGLFVNKAGAAVSVVSMVFLNCSVLGGQSGQGLPNYPAGAMGGGGGGGLGGNGGDSAILGPFEGGGGGGGVLGGGGAAVGAGGLGGGGGGGGVPTGAGGAGGAAYAGNSAGGSDGRIGDIGFGGAGGFGGGGGGASSEGPAGAGGFGGGGGGANNSGGGPGSNGANGGPGGGGGGSLAGTTPGSGGALATLSGGNGNVGVSLNSGNGGGGAAAGPAIFVNAGSLTTTLSEAGSMSAVSGGSDPNGGTADATPVFNYAGTVNGSATAGPVASALTGRPSH